MTTVLIVDDHAPFRASARTLLELDGFQVVGEAEDGAAAVELAERLRPDLVLLDVALPDTDGFAVAERLSRTAEQPDVVLVSSRSRTDYGSRIAAAPVRGFIAKDDLTGGALQELLE